MQLPMKRRQALKLTGSAAVAGTTMTAGCLGGSGSSNGESADGLTTVDYMMTDGEVDIPIFLSQEEAWNEVGIDLEPELTSYDRYSRSLYSTGELDLGNVNLAILNQSYSAGEDIVVFGGNELETNGVWTRADSDIDSVADFDEDTRVGVPFWDSGTTNFARGTIMEEFGIDIREDTNSTSAEPPVLWELLTEQEDLDAIINFTLFAFKGLANPDLVDRIFAPEEWFEEEYGSAPLVTMFAARREWIEQPENAQLALNFMEGWDTANERFSANLDENMEQYGRFAGLETEAEIDVVRDKYANDNITIESTDWDDDYIDIQIQALEILEEQGLIDEAPPREQGISHSELVDLADQ